MRSRVCGALLALLIMTATVPGPGVGSWTRDRYRGGGGGGGGAAQTMVTREVRIKQGWLQGLVMELQSPNLGPVDAFLGVPYALAPVGSKRFVPPSAPPPWEGLREAFSYAPVCPQRPPNMQDVSDERYNYLKRLLPYLSNTSEDCLYLNIYVPQQA
ncbi:neuroligin-2-like [Schistocerca nitens]|uniref:neuroligin-2-like n=1 Tax=Schistocerca nitens TaxID=7011 RepID=UPI002118B5FB|nr:neuroligin-2-like [Schistocerca nitens]